MVHVILHETLETEPFAQVITELCVYAPRDTHTENVSYDERQEYAISEDG